MAILNLGSVQGKEGRREGKEEERTRKHPERKDEGGGGWWSPEHPTASCLESRTQTTGEEPQEEDFMSAPSSLQPMVL